LTESGKVANLPGIAKLESADCSYVRRMVKLTTLAPDFLAAILDQTLPDAVSLFGSAIDTPLCWEDQRKRERIQVKLIDLYISGCGE